MPANRFYFLDNHWYFHSDLGDQYLYDPDEHVIIHQFWAVAFTLGGESFIKSRRINPLNAKPTTYMGAAFKELIEMLSVIYP